jgi:hypothetical protein
MILVLVLMILSIPLEPMLKEVALLFTELQMAQLKQFLLLRLKEPLTGILRPDMHLQSLEDHSIS